MPAPKHHGEQALSPEAGCEKQELHGHLWGLVENVDLAAGQQHHEDTAPEATARQSMMGEGAGVVPSGEGALSPVH